MKTTDRDALTRLLPDYDPGVGTLSRMPGEGGPSPGGWVGEGNVFGEERRGFPESRRDVIC
jgi:hypothetical protein